MAALLSPLVEFPDVWYDPNVLAIVGSVSWIVAMLATAYFVLRWLRRSEKFYADLKAQRAARAPMPPAAEGTTAAMAAYGGDE